MRNYFFDGCISVENKIYFVTDDKLLMSIDKSDLGLEYEIADRLVEIPLHNISCHEDVLVWISLDGKKVCNYNTLNNQYDEVYMDTEEVVLDDIVFEYVFEGKMYVIDKKSILYVYDIDKRKGENIIHLNRTWENIECAVGYKNDIYIFEKEAVHEIDLLNLKCCVLETKLENVIKRVVLIDDSIYMIDEKEGLLKWNVEKENVESVFDCSTIVGGISQIAVTEKKIFLLPWKSKEIYEYCLRSKVVKEIDEYPLEHTYYNHEYYKYNFFTMDNDYIWFSNRLSNYWLRIRKDSSEIEFYRPALRCPKYEKGILGTLGLESFNEAAIGLKEYIEYIKE